MSMTTATERAAISVLSWIVENYASDISHVDFRVDAYRFALAALSGLPKDGEDDPYLETDVGQCHDCSGDGCGDDDEPVSKAGRSAIWGAPYDE